jgi:hypothetical protein
MLQNLKHIEHHHKATSGKSYTIKQSFIHKIILKYYVKSPSGYMYMKQMTFWFIGSYP